MTEKDKPQEEEQIEKDQIDKEGKDRPYNHQKKVKELLDESGETSPHADPFMGF